jgi:hypothetical protein
MDPLFPALPEDLGALTVEELEALAAEFQSVASRVAENDDTLIGDTPGTDVIEQMTNGVVALETIRAEITRRSDEEQAYTSQVAELAAQFADAPADDVEDAPASETLAESDDDEENEDEDEEADETDAPEGDASADADAEEEPVTASVAVRRPAAVPASHRPRVTVNEAAPLLASSGLDPVARSGQRMDRMTLARAMGEAWYRGGALGKTVVASAQFEFPQDRLMSPDNAARNADLIYGLTGPEALAASGGFCAPYPPRYDVQFLGTAARPVRDALPTAGAERGGIQYPAPLGISDVSDAITVVTAALDEAGGSLAAKGVLVIQCDEFLTAEVHAVAGRVRHGNLNARAWPERVAAVNDLVAIAHAQAAETELLAGLTAGSTAVTQAATYGSYSTLVSGILRAAAAYRSRHRMDPTTRLRAMFPAWVRELVAADLAHESFGRLTPEAAITAVENHLASAGVAVTWYIDQDGTTTQVYDAQTAGTLDAFLTSVVWYLFAEGTWLYLDMGRLDVGIYRDSDLVASNDFESFYETFEGIAKIGVESLRIESTVCSSGETAAPNDNLITC